jgi:hopene-associated glycosyltransferase HpnB
MIAVLVDKLENQRLDMVSAMVCLRMVSFWERLLMPAFVYFFKMLYPFQLSNSSFSRIAAGAGGCILIRTHVLKQIGGYRSIRCQLIDDCALARRVKAHGYRIWIGLTHSASSLRAYDHLAPIWNMVARTAFYQLKYSRILLLITTLGMLMLFGWPLMGLLLPQTAHRLLAIAALLAMMCTYLPILSFYGRSRLWATALPLISVLYLAMTWTSALRYWRGEGSTWKGRHYQQECD